MRCMRIRVMNRTLVDRRDGGVLAELGTGLMAGDLARGGVNLAIGTSSAALAPLDGV